MRRLRTFAPLVVFGALLFLAESPAGAAPGRAARPGPAVDVVKVEGLIDAAVAGYVTDTLRSAERSGAAVILQLDSLGSFKEQAESLARAIRTSRVPVISWVGPSGARAAGSALYLVYSSSLTAMAPGAALGPADPFDLSTTASREDPAAAARGVAGLKALASRSHSSPAAMERLARNVLPAGPARQAGAVSVVAPDIPTLLRQLNGRSVPVAGGRAVTLKTSGTGVPAQVRFHDLGPWRRLLHAVGTPTALFVLLILGLWGVAFEFTQPGIGIAGIMGALALSLAGYALTVVPVNPAGLALLLGGVGLQALDVVIRRVGPLTLAGTVAFIAGSIWAWAAIAPSADISLWLILLAGVAGFLFFGFAMTVALKAKERARSAQVGLVGLTGEARKDIDPEGAVSVKGALWRARSSNGAIRKGAKVRVRGIDGLILRVEEEPTE